MSFRRPPFTGDIMHGRTLQSPDFGPPGCALLWQPSPRPRLKKIERTPPPPPASRVWLVEMAKKWALSRTHQTPRRCCLGSQQSSHQRWRWCKTGGSGCPGKLEAMFTQCAHVHNCVSRYLLASIVNWSCSFGNSHLWRENTERTRAMVTLLVVLGVGTKGGGGDFTLRPGPMLTQ